MKTWNWNKHRSVSWRVGLGRRMSYSCLCVSRRRRPGCEMIRTLPYFNCIVTVLSDCLFKQCVIIRQYLHTPNTHPHPHTHPHTHSYTLALARAKKGVGGTQKKQNLYLLSRSCKQTKKRTNWETPCNVCDLLNFCMLICVNASVCAPSLYTVLSSYSHHP